MGDSYNPFSRNRTTPSPARASSWGPEAPGRSRTWASDNETPIGHNVTEPPRVQEGLFLPGDHEIVTTPAHATSSDQGDNASVQYFVSHRPPSQGGKARRRFVGKFFHRMAGLDELEADEENCEEQKSRWKKKVHKPFTVNNQLAAVIMVSWVRVLLLLTPVGFAVHYSHRGSTADFLVNFFAILPLTDMFGQALVEVKTWAGDPRLELVAYVLCGQIVRLLARTVLTSGFRNTNQTITSAVLLHSHQITVLKSTLLGGMLLRILLITSIAILTNDSRHRFQKKSLAVSLSKHLSIALTGLIIPTALSIITTPDNTNVLKQSRGVSVVLISLYGLYLYSEWRVYSLLGLMSLVDSKDDKKVGKGFIALSGGHVKFAMSLAGMIAAAPGRPAMRSRVKEPEPPEDELIDINAMNEKEDVGEKEPQPHFWLSISLLFIMGALLALHILFISDSLVGFTQETGTSEESLGTIMFMTPLMVLIGWAAGIPGVDLLFSPFEVTVLFPAVLVVQSSIEENDKGLSGALLFSTYLTIAIAAWFQK
ncbi:uncharacterized protein PAC_10330 [Phialocephala subalpina]|uniref:Sodium/calcium exchanger membrane region domain-containing protein n=1 Tax=Phialocephala subalpina TaxID=576137 RepID=A0A1L7X620_9HELO|nr:uncharacterized protein PAC_10330 [Phialocephala subalpina]